MSVDDPQSVWRFGSALNLNLHFHALVLDGVYASPEPLTRPRFHPAEPLSDRDVEDVTVLLHRRIRRHLWRTGPLRRNADELEPVPDEPLLAELYAASVQGRGVLAERGESALRPIAHRRDARPLSLPGELCASLGGLSLHAKVTLVADDHEGRERLARYLLRPPIASERLSLDEHGRVVYRLRRHWNDGTRAVVFAPLEFIARLAALVPTPYSQCPSSESKAAESLCSRQCRRFASSNRSSVTGSIRNQWGRPGPPTTVGSSTPVRAQCRTRLGLTPTRAATACADHKPSARRCGARWPFGDGRYKSWS